jgi:hypothetical protein
MVGNVHVGGCLRRKNAGVAVELHSDVRRSTNNQGGAGSVPGYSVTKSQ